MTFYWTFTDVGTIAGATCSFYTYFQFLIEFSTPIAGQVPINQYTKRQYAVRAPKGMAKSDILFYWKCGGLSPDWPGAEVRVDDISLIEYEPPCVVVDQPPQDLVCGQSGVFHNPSASTYLIENRMALGPFEFCAQACAENPECKTFTRDVNTLNTRCKLYSATPQELDFRPSSGVGTYEPDCFVCR